MLGLVNHNHPAGALQAVDDLRRNLPGHPFPHSQRVRQKLIDSGNGRVSRGNRDPNRQAVLLQIMPAGLRLPDACVSIGHRDFSAHMAVFNGIFNGT